MLKYLQLSILSAFLFTNLFAQQLKPGFDKQEFLELLKIGARTTADSSYYKKLPAPQRSTLVYQSNNIGFDNFWQLWRMNDGIGVISVRGTTKTAVSFFANMYAAMVPAKGKLELEKDFTFDYDLSEDPRAAVHVGFLVAMAYLSRDILPKIDSCYKAGMKEFIIAGHSQGAAITYSLTSYLENLKKENRLPKDIRFKTCASASPKPGNLYYAYDFENLTKNGWSYNVVNSVDWVPELPFSIQTLNDMSATNPFVNAKKMIRKQKFPASLVLRIAYNQLSKPAKKAQRKYEKWLGKRFGKFVKKKGLKEITLPDYFHSNSYVRTGTTIVLVPDSSYFVKFPEIKDSVWHNHIHAPYIFLTEKYGVVNNTNTASTWLDGFWQLDYIAGQKISFDSLFPFKKPMLSLNISKHEVTGYTGCNPLRGTLLVNMSKINLTDATIISQMPCPVEGEKIFIETLRSITNYTINESGLTLITGDIAIMHFIRKN